MVVASKLLAVIEPASNDRVLRVVGGSEGSIVYSINPSYVSQTRLFSGFATFQMSSGYAYSSDEKLSNSICRVEPCRREDGENGIREILTIPMEEIKKLGRVALLLDTKGSVISSEDAISSPNSMLPNHKGRVSDLLITNERFARVNGIRPGDVVSLVQDPTKSKLEASSVLYESLRDRSLYLV